MYGEQRCSGMSKGRKCQKKGQNGVARQTSKGHSKSVFLDLLFTK